MSYATPVDAIKYLSANRLAEITGYTAGVNVSTDADLIPINLFRDAILGNDLSDYSDEQQADVVVAIEVLEKALSSASSLIDSYLMRSYSLPLITYPEWITEACVSLANCSLHDDNTVEPIREKCTYYTKLLEAVASGKLKLYPVTSEDVTVASISKIAVKSSDRVFTDALFSKIL